MNTIHLTRLWVRLAGLAVAAALWPVAQAQTASAPESRGEVKAQTRAANKAGQLTKAGEGTPTEKAAPGASTKTREERKAETMEAKRKGELQPPGQALYKSNMSQQSAKTTKTRAERKAETRQAAKEKKLVPAGEAAEPAKK